MNLVFSKACEIAFGRGYLLLEHGRAHHELKGYSDPSPPKCRLTYVVRSETADISKIEELLAIAKEAGTTLAAEVHKNIFQWAGLLADWHSVPHAINAEGPLRSDFYKKLGIDPEKCKPASDNEVLSWFGFVSPINNRNGPGLMEVRFNLKTCELKTMGLHPPA